MSTKAVTSIKWQESLSYVSRSWLLSSNINELPKNPAELRVFIIEHKNKNDIRQSLKDILTDTEIKKVQNSISAVELFQRGFDYILVLQPLKSARKKAKNNSSVLPPSDYAVFRDAMGVLGTLILQKELSSCSVVLHQLKKAQLRGALVGLEIINYKFKIRLKGADPLCKLYVTKSKGQILKTELVDAAMTGVGVNLARHLVNLPANWLTPSSYCEVVNRLFLKLPKVQVEIWKQPELNRQKMGLMLGVGSGSEHSPAMIRIKYRPQAGKPPVAIVGKGVTYDTGGANIKPSSGMRNMKKDMGGSAACVGLAFALASMKSPQAFDVYLAVAENSISGECYVPGDILQARNGTTVEIHNTDAEGRLVVADVLDVATSQSGKDKPQCVVDVCTLTGAIKVGLGANIAGFFTNSDQLNKKIEVAATEAGELLWRMPLYPEYTSMLKSSVADMTNCASSGFGGAITAALFLQEFTNEVPWGHFDIYAWNDSATGACLENGGSGQAVQNLVEVFKNGY